MLCMVNANRTLGAFGRHPPLLRGLLLMAVTRWRDIYAPTRRRSSEDHMAFARAHK